VSWFAANWGNLASVLGLAFSVASVVFARRASRAATEAKRAAWRRSINEDMSDARQFVVELLGYVNMNKDELALVRANDLQNRTSYILARWTDLLNARSTRNLLSAREQVTVIQDALSGRANTPADRAGLLQSCQRLAVIFSEEAGTAVKLSEAGG
jgi:hypothetical protein